METEETEIQKTNLAQYKARQRKTFGVPILPLSIDAMYDNHWKGNLIPYAIDANPARMDPVYLKLKELERPNISLSRMNPESIVAAHHMRNLEARQMDESTYNHLLKMPINVLKKEFALTYKINPEIRLKIEKDYEYMFRINQRLWTDC